jgi:hypothetical protein
VCGFIEIERPLYKSGRVGCARVQRLPASGTRIVGAAAIAAPRILAAEYVRPEAIRATEDTIRVVTKKRESVVYVARAQLSQTPLRRRFLRGHGSPIDYRALTPAFSPRTRGQCGAGPFAA